MNNEVKCNRKKCCRLETLNLSTCADRSTNTKMDRKVYIFFSLFFFLLYVMCHVSLVICHESFVTCHVSHVTCQLSLTPTTTASNNPPAKSPTMHSRLVQKNFKERAQKNKTKTSRGMPILAIHSMTRSLQSTRKRGFQTWTDKKTDREVTDIATFKLNRPRGQISENLWL